MSTFPKIILIDFGYEKLFNHYIHSKNIYYAYHMVVFSTFRVGKGIVNDNQCNDVNVHFYCSEKKLLTSKAYLFI